ncbi:hypothetical protein nbrc107696_02680 [Gordonia spumicola]|uniref:2-oxoacid dehydrogenase acyltransferase catalytic domain-containing protein n=1 Tax=Gordonia spumicola TaxID=589161 RepID=A0A7I9V3S5_9ACTN|nr:2-oxo acid dehydrogenase subunit E2 [Gordonia spumicola]GED99821.1 hypothetical protein nbrc107696_02680 [Gordonia spumicola]
MTEQTTRLTRIRAIIAQRMHASLSTTAQLTSVVEVDVTDVMDARRAHGATFKERHGVSLSPFAVIARAATLALAEHPLLNSAIDVDAGTRTTHPEVNLGVAVDTEAGLLVPNIKSAQDLDVVGLAGAITELAGKARGRGLKPADLEGGTFTLTNTGSRGSILDTPILNAPEVGILATGAVERRVMAIGEIDSETIAVRDCAYLCLTYDHRLVDGADAARYLGTVKDILESGRLLDELGLAPAKASL